MDHHFNTEIAEKYGVPEAIMLHNICFWQHKNTVNNKNFHDGRYWTYNSVSAFGLLFTYLSDKQIALILKKIEKKGCVAIGRYNKMKIDRTKWYSANLDIMAIHGFEANPLKREMQLPNKGNAKDQKGKCILPNGEKDNTKRDIGITEKVEPIPDNKPNSNSNNKPQIINTYRSFAHLSLSQLEFEKLLLKNTKEEIDEILDSIENYNKNKNYKSLFVTARSWLKKSFSKEKNNSANFGKTQVPEESNYSKVKKVHDKVIELYSNSPAPTTERIDHFAPEE